MSDSGAVHRGVLAAVRSKRPPHPHASPPSFVTADGGAVGGAGMDPTAVLMSVVAGVRLGSAEFVEGIEGPAAGPAEGVRPIAPVSTASGPSSSSVWTA